MHTVKLVVFHHMHLLIYFFMSYAGVVSLRQWFFDLFIRCADLYEFAKPAWDGLRLLLNLAFSSLLQSRCFHTTIRNLYVHFIFED